MFHTSLMFEMHWLSNGFAPYIPCCLLRAEVQWINYELLLCNVCELLLTQESMPHFAGLERECLFSGQCCRCQCGRTGCSPWPTSTPTTLNSRRSPTWSCLSSACFSITPSSMSLGAGGFGSTRSPYCIPR